MKSTRLYKRSKRKLFLPVFLIGFLVLVVLGGLLRKVDLNLSRESQTTLFSPLPSSSPKDDLENLLKEHGFIPKSLTYKDDMVQASFSGNLTVILSTSKDLTTQVLSLQFVISRAKIENRLPKVVDLRFTKPVVLY